MNSAAPAASQDERPIHEFQKNAREVVRSDLTTFKGYDLASFRAWAIDGDKAVPTKAGLALRVEKLVDLRAAVDALIAEARRRGLIATG